MLLYPGGVREVHNTLVFAVTCSPLHSCAVSLYKAQCKDIAVLANQCAYVTAGIQE